MHDQVRIRQPLVNRDEHVHLEHAAIRLLVELVCAVAGADGNGQRVHAGALGKFDSLVGIGDVLQARAACAMAVFHAAQHANLAFDGHAALVRVVHHAPRHFHVFVEGRRRLAVFLQRAIHHHRGVTQRDGALAGLKTVAVILMHGDGNSGIQLRRGLDQLEKVEVLGKRARAAAGLNNDRRVGLPGGHHDGLNLLHIVHVERADAVSALGSFVEELPHGN